MINSIKMCNAIRWREKIWFSNAEANGLYVIEENEVKFVDVFPDEDCIHKLIHRWIFEYNDKLFFIPYQGKNIHVYDGSGIRTIKIKEEYDEYPLIGNSVYQFDNLLYILPPNICRDMLIFNMQTNELSVDHRFKIELSKFQEHNRKMMSDEVFIHIMKGFETNTITFLYDCRWLLEWDVETGKISIEEDFGEDNLVYWVMQDKEWVYYANGAYLKTTDSTTNEQKSIALEGLELNQSIMDCVKQGETMYFVYDGARCIVKFSAGKLDYFNIDEIYSNADVLGFNGLIEHRVIDKDIWIFSPAREEIIIIKESGTIDVMRPKLSDNAIKILQKQCLINSIENLGDICDESKYELAVFLEYIQGK